MSKDQMFAKVVLASKPTNGAPPIITMHLRYPRIIHGEIMTHRVFSRNARSSRAVPVATMLKEIRETPFVPWHWGKNQKGMQADIECNERINIYADGIDDPLMNETREGAWLLARDQAVRFAQAYSEAGYHKQIANRLIEPFSFIDTLVTSTSWANFFHLRDHNDAEPHFQDLARMMRVAIDGADFEELTTGDWHLPYITDEDRSTVVWWITRRQPPHNIPSAQVVSETLLKLSVARCARISYKPFDGDGSIERELERYNQLVGSHPLHASPAEHQAQVDEYAGDPMSNDFIGYANERLSGNLGPGWIQYRKTLPGEFVADVA